MNIFRWLFHCLLGFEYVLYKGVTGSAAIHRVYKIGDNYFILDYIHFQQIYPNGHVGERVRYTSDDLEVWQPITKWSYEFKDD